MGMTFHHGPNLSGRSEALRLAAWGAERDRGGTYLQPNAVANFSGLARTVGGECFLHNLGAAQPVRRDPAAVGLINDLPPTQSLLTLSGGQQARLALACALARPVPILAIDGLLEQLDAATRALVAEALADRDGVELSDNYTLPFAARAEATVRHVQEGGASLNEALAQIAHSLEGRAVRAPTLEVLDLDFGYRRASPVFRKVSHRFEPGRPYLLKAPNGAGKSTLARILLGVERPSRGRILVNGVEHSPRRSDRNLLFYAFQNPQDQLFGPSVRGYLERLVAASASRQTFLGGTLGFDPAGLIDAAGIGRFADLEPFELPWFVAKRVSVIAALLSGSPWFFLDEPSLGSDVEGRASFARLADALTRAGLGLIIVSHGEEFDSLPDVQRITIRDARIVPGGPDA